MVSRAKYRVGRGSREKGRASLNPANGCCDQRFYDVFSYVSLTEPSDGEQGHTAFDPEVRAGPDGSGTKMISFGRMNRMRNVLRWLIGKERKAKGALPPSRPFSWTLPVALSVATELKELESRTGMALEQETVGLGEEKTSQS